MLGAGTRLSVVVMKPLCRASELEQRLEVSTEGEPHGESPGRDVLREGWWRRSPARGLPGWGVQRLSTQQWKLSGEPRESAW